MKAILAIPPCCGSNQSSAFCSGHNSGHEFSHSSQGLDSFLHSAGHGRPALHLALDMALLLALLLGWETSPDTALFATLNMPLLMVVHKTLLTSLM